MNFGIKDGRDDWLKQVQLHQSGGAFVGYYQNAISHCCGLSAIGQPFYNKKPTKKDVDDLISFLQQQFDSAWCMDTRVYFNSPCVLFTVSIENGDRLDALTNHPEIKRIHSFTNTTGNTVGIYALTLRATLENDDD